MIPVPKYCFKIEIRIRSLSDNFWQKWSYRIYKCKSKIVLMFLKEKKKKLAYRDMIHTLPLIFNWNLEPSLSIHHRAGKTGRGRGWECWDPQFLILIQAKPSSLSFFTSLIFPCETLFTFLECSMQCTQLGIKNLNNRTIYQKLGSS